MTENGSGTDLQVMRESAAMFGTMDLIAWISLLLTVHAILSNVAILACSWTLRNGIGLGSPVGFLAFAG